MSSRQVFGWSYRLRRFWRARGTTILWIAVALVLGVLIWSLLVSEAQGSSVFCGSSPMGISLAAHQLRAV